jgi:thiol-disulfide isomerase/thioredoxin
MMRINKLTTVFFLILFSPLYLFSQDDPARVGLEPPIFSMPLIVFKDFNDLQKNFIDLKSNKIKVINFWATWCKPCVRELPYFQSLSIKEGKDFDFYLVSLDKPADAVKVSEFLSKKQITITSSLLADSNSNEWINKVSEEWSGSIPATLVMTNDKSYFFEKEFESYNELYLELSKYIKKSK